MTSVGSWMWSLDWENLDELAAISKIITLDISNVEAIYYTTMILDPPSQFVKPISLPDLVSRPSIADNVTLHVDMNISFDPVARNKYANFTFVASLTRGTLKSSNKNI